MDSTSRRLLFQKIAGNLSALVEKKLSIPPTEKADKLPKIDQSLEESKLSFSTLGSVGPGTTVMLPQNPINSDESVNIIINIRGISGGDTKTASSLGKNAVVVTAEAGGLGSKENQIKFGNANFINQAVNKVLEFLKKKYSNPNIKRGKLIVSGFSGGGGAVANLLTQRDQVKGDIDAVIINDGLHANPNSPAMKAVLDFAKETTQNPNKQFNLVHTAVKPGGYPSTTETANFILKNLGLNRQPVLDWKGIGPKPISQASQGGLKITQLYDKEQPYMAKDPITGKTKPNIKGKTSGGQHISSLEWMPNLFHDLNLS